MAEGAVIYVLSLNFDLAVQNAAVHLGAQIEVIDSVNDPVPMRPTVVHLHGSATGPAESLILREEALTAEWRGAWQQIVANQILAAPTVLFVGLGSAAPVLTETIGMITAALGDHRTIYQADICEHGDSYFASQLHVPDDHFVRKGWSELMVELAARVAAEQVHSLADTGSRVLQENQAPAGDAQAFTAMAASHSALPLLGLGKLRALAKLDLSSLYVPRSEDLEEHMAEPLAKLGRACQEIGIVAIPTATGVWCLERNGHRAGTALVVTGRGTRRLVALESRIRQVCRQIGDDTLASPDIVIVGGVQPEPAVLDMQVDIIADEAANDLVGGPSEPLIITAASTDLTEELGRLLNAA